MCGLVGLAGNVTAKNRDVFTEFLLVDVVRGHHSTGVAAVKRFNNEVTMVKAPMPSPIFIGTKEYQDLVSNQNMKVLIGHNRFATVGEKTVENSHPFKFPNIVGAHNGTLDAFAHKQIPNYKDYGTDSEALYSLIDQKGVKEAIGDVSGAWALSWYDQAAGSMNLLRNDKRPLFYAYSEDRETLYWASEKDMLDWILGRNGIKLFENGIFECEADQHYKWVLPAKAADKFGKPVVQKVEGQVFTTGGRSTGWKYDSSTGYGAYGNYGGHSHSSTTTTVTDQKVGGPVLQPKKVATNKVNTKKFRPPYKDAYGRIINKVNFNKLVSNGCVFCDDSSSTWGDFIHPLKDDMDGRKLYLCEDCYNDDETREIVINVL